MKLFNDNVLKDAIDIHIHVGPDYIPRYSDAITLAEEARDAGMKAIVIKGHLSNTCAGAQAAELLVPEVKVFSSISLNGTVGGLSPRSVIVAAKSGAKVVWLPTTDAKYAMDKAQEGHWIKHYVNSSTFAYEVERLTVTDESGELKPEARDIIRICKEHDMVLCSGHISPDECIAVLKFAKEIGFTRLEITHPNDWMEDFTIEKMKEMVSYGAYLSLAYGACSPHNGRQDPEEILQIIKEVGAEHCIMMTDYGQVNSPAPADGLRVFYYLMKKLGCTTEELDMMIKTNPAKLLGIEEQTTNLA